MRHMVGDVVAQLRCTRPGRLIPEARGELISKYYVL